MLKTIPLLNYEVKLWSALLTNRKGDFRFFEAGKTEKMTKIFKNLKKMRILSKKLLKFVIFKSWNLFHGN